MTMLLVKAVWVVSLVIAIAAYIVTCKPQLFLE
jgi:hypothetical protein